jgi:hypothetical protein
VVALVNELALLNGQGCHNGDRLLQLILVCRLGEGPNGRREGPAKGLSFSLCAEWS